MRLYIGIVFAAFLVCLTAAWDPDDHEIFRLNDDVQLHEGANATFYSFLGVARKANRDEINRAYRKKAARMHPDKARQSFIANYGKPKPNEKKKGPKVHKQPSKREVDAYHKEASERFARLGIVTNILRGANRERYDHFLDYGFPKWRGTGYYYQRYRPGLATVLLGLFAMFGGAAHYGALILTWKRQKEFTEKYIKNARKLAWGSSLVVPGLDTPAPVVSNGNGELAEDSPAMNRRQRRLQEKDSKKAAKKGLPDEISAPIEPQLISGPQGSKRRVVAENGKVLIVDSAGNVFLEEETKEGETHEYLIDVNEIAKPTIYDTAVVKLPLWVWRKTGGRFLSNTVDPPTLDDSDSAEEDTSEAALRNATALNPNGEARRRKAKVTRRRP